MDSAVGKPEQETNEPLGPGRIPIPSELREVQRNVMQQQTVLQSHARQRDLKVRVRELLQITRPGNQLNIIGQDHTLGQHGKDDLRIFWIVLIPGSVARHAHQSY